MSTAVAMTAVVHFFNNLFKLVLVGRYADKGAVRLIVAIFLLLIAMGPGTVVL